MPAEALAKAGAGNGNRTRISTLGRSYSTIESYPQITPLLHYQYSNGNEKAREGSVVVLPSLYTELECQRYSFVSSRLPAGEMAK